MQRLALTLFVLLAFAATVLLLKKAPENSTSAPSPPSVEMSNSDEESDQLATPKPKREAVQDVRPIAPEQFGLPFSSNLTTLERIEPRKPEPPKPAPSSSPEGGILLSQPQVSAATTLTFGSRTVALKGLKAIGARDVCKGADGKDWPCGAVARTMLQRYLRNRAILCALDSRQWEGVVEASCTVGGEDIGTWLAEYGWAEAITGSPYAEISAEARIARKGIFGDRP